MDSLGSTPLHLASSEGHLEMVGVLLENGAYTQAIDHLRNTPLHTASFEGFAEVVKALIEKGATIDVVNDRGATPLQLAALMNRVEVVKVLLAKGACVEVMAQSRIGPLGLASEEGHIEVVKVLLESKINSKVSTRDEETALLVSAQKEYVDVCRCITGFFYSLANFTKQELQASKSRLFAGLLCLKKTSISQDLFYTILLSAEELRRDVARILIDELQKVHDISNGSLLAYKEAQESAARLVLEQCKPSLITIYKELDEGNSLKEFFDPFKPEKILNCIQEGIGSCLLARRATLEGPQAGSLCLCCEKPMDKPQRCSRCKKARYCNRDCQKRHWATHKVCCKSQR